MSFGTLVVLASFVGTLAVRVNVNKVTQDVDTAEMRTNMCNLWLVVSYDNGKNEESGVGSYRLVEWSNAHLFTKKLKNGCTKTYTAECQAGHLKVETACLGHNETDVDTRCLGGFGCFGAVGGRKSTVGEDEQITLKLPESAEITIGSGKAVVWTIDPEKGIDLEDAPGNYKWKAVDGCYCCKHNYGVLGNPFSYSGHRKAWKRTDDGNMECMLAWRMIGNFMNHKNPANSSSAGVLALVPEFVFAAADMFTLTIGRHIACASTCPFRKEKYEQNQYAFTKIQTSMDKY
mmetsp:Transcript_102580/g.161937  ORF Transcript_102580/g.161937 Transcript_102580/m.161937 type:complete len:289 (+) Transcript_102580:88-954(+)